MSQWSVKLSRCQWSSKVTCRETPPRRSAREYSYTAPALKGASAADDGRVRDANSPLSAGACGEHPGQQQQNRNEGCHTHATAPETETDTSSRSNTRSQAPPDPRSQHQHARMRLAATPIAGKVPAKARCQADKPHTNRQPLAHPTQIAPNTRGRYRSFTHLIHQHSADDAAMGHPPCLAPVHQTSSTPQTHHSALV